MKANPLVLENKKSMICEWVKNIQIITVQRLTLEDVNQNRTWKGCNKGPGQGNVSGRKDVDWVVQRRLWRSRKILEILREDALSLWRKHYKMVGRGCSSSRTSPWYIIHLKLFPVNPSYFIFSWVLQSQCLHIVYYQRIMQSHGETVGSAGQPVVVRLSDSKIQTD